MIEREGSLTPFGCNFTHKMSASCEYKARRWPSIYLTWKTSSIMYLMFPHPRYAKHHLCDLTEKESCVVFLHRLPDISVPRAATLMLFVSYTYSVYCKIKLGVKAILHPNAHDNSIWVIRTWLALLVLSGSSVN